MKTTALASSYGLDTVELDVSDYICLDRHVSIADGVLVDRLGNRQMTVNATAGIALRLLAEGGRFGNAIDRYSDATCVDHATATRDVLSIAAQCDSLALLVVRPRLRSRMHLAALLSLLGAIFTLSWSRPAARRYPPSMSGLLRAVARSCRLGLAGAVFTSFGLTVVLLPLSATASSPEGVAVTAGEVVNGILYGFLPLALYIVLTLQMIAHEAGHLAAARRAGVVRFVVVRGLRLYVSHTSDQPGDVSRIAAAGPLAGLAVGLLLAVVAAVVGLPSGSIALAVAMALPHLWCMLPWSSDGRALWHRPSPGGSRAAA